MEQEATNRETDVMRGSFVLEHPHQVEIYSRLRRLIVPHYPASAGRLEMK